MPILIGYISFISRRKLNWILLFMFESESGYFCFHDNAMHGNIRIHVHVPSAFMLILFMIVSELID